MEKQMSVRLVHYFDTEQHRVLCGARTAEDHSTKHARGISCERCIAILRERAESSAPRHEAEATSGAGV